MSTNHKAQPIHARTSVPTIKLFTRTLQTCWAVLFAITIVSEIYPLRPVPAKVFYSYLIFRGILFVLLGFLTPLAFWRFDSLTLGLLSSVVSAGFVEILQSFSGGHRASYLEFSAKAAVLFVGFALALNTRYNGIVRLGTFYRYLVNPHQKD